MEELEDLERYLSRAEILTWGGVGLDCGHPEKHLIVLAGGVQAIAKPGIENLESVVTRGCWMAGRQGVGLRRTRSRHRRARSASALDRRQHHVVQGESLDNAVRATALELPVARNRVERNLLAVLRGRYPGRPVTLVRDEVNASLDLETATGPDTNRLKQAS